MKGTRLSCKWLGRILPFVPVMVLICGLTGCMAPPVPRENALVVNQYGQSLHPDYGNGRSAGRNKFLKPESRAALAAHLSAITNAIATCPDCRTNGTINILIYIHGGLNTYADGMENATNDLPQIVAHRYYPLFVCWNSSLWSSYGEHLVSIRQGEPKHFWGWGGLTSPLCLAADFGAAITRAPLVFYYQVSDDLSTIRQNTAFPGSAKDRRRRRPQIFVKEPGVKFQEGADLREWPDKLGHAASYALTFPFKLVTAPIIDACGKSSWDVMRRRTQLMFRTQNEFNRPAETNEIKIAKRRVGSPPDGAVGQMMQSLDNLISHDRAHRYEITLVGHSMGTIVANEMIRMYPDLPYSNIVYMAAACTVSDFSRSVIPYLERSPGARFYGLTLHPTAEARETHWWPYCELSPRGSLLEWIDNFLGNPTTVPERTFGKWNNVISTTALIPKTVAGQIQIKAFQVGPADKVASNTPQAHGDFSREPFWLGAFWTNPPDWNIPSTR